MSNKIYIHHCQDCGRDFPAKSSPAAHLKRCPLCHTAWLQNRAQEAKKRGQKTCAICGKPSGSAKSCSEECRLELRRRNRKAQAERAKEKISTADSICLKCDQPFKATGKFNRICPACRVANAEFHRGAEYWGGVA
jgi:hypothetical protein